jgi:Formyl transferase
MRFTRLMWPSGGFRDSCYHLPVVVNKRSKSEVIQNIRTINYSTLKAEERKKYCHNQRFFCYSPLIVREGKYSAFKGWSCSCFLYSGRSTRRQFGGCSAVNLPDLVIVGVVACGVAVAIQMIERVKQGKRLRSIALVEKSSSIGQASRYALRSLARDVEDYPVEALTWVMRGIREEIERTNFTDWSELTTAIEPLAELRSDITKAESGATSWQAVIRATSLIIERFWDCFSTEEKATFLREYNSTWSTYHHAIPLENARKMLLLMEKGQLRVVRGQRNPWTGSEFVVPTKNAQIRSQFLIEAVDQEYDPYPANSRFPQRLLSSRLLNPHPARGVSVNYTTSAATKGIYVVGSMTRGVHFHTNAIDRNVAHAARISDGLTGEPPRRPLHIAFFVGSDLFSHLMLSELVSHLVALGHTPFVFLPSHRVGKKSRATFALREVSFFERELFQEHVIPFLRHSPPQRAASLTVEQMRYHYGILVQRIPNINDSSFLQTLRNNHIDVGISLRCYQRFRGDIINYLKSPRALLNLHQGVLPSYRGVMTAVRAMMKGEREFGYTLHHVNEEYDEGDVIDIRTGPIDYQKPMLHWMEDFYQIGVDMTLSAVESLSRRKPLPAFRQDQTNGRYYTFPTAEELEIYRLSGLRLVDPSAIHNLIVRSFAPPGEEDALRQVIEKATNEWYGNAENQLHS